MNIPELKEAMEMAKEFRIKNGGIAATGKYDALHTLLSACQLLCDTSDKLPPKKEVVEKHLYDMGKDDGYNLAREEDILYLTKKLMGIKEVVCPDNRGDTCLDHRNCEGIATAIIQSFGQEKEG